MSCTAAVALIAAVALAAQPALAQPLGPEAETSYFRAFFFPDGTGLGTAIVWTLLLMSVAVIALILQQVIQTREATFMPPEFSEGLERLIAEKNFREAIELSNAEPSAFGQIMRQSLNEAPRGYQAMEETVEEVADELGNRRIRRLIWLEVCGAAGPMLGLFGTVFGMIVAFQELALSGGQPKPAELAAGIGTALVTTFWGLVVGIPGVVAASVFRTKLDGLTAEAITRGKHLIGGFRPGAKKPAGPGPAPGPATPKPLAT